MESDIARTVVRLVAAAAKVTPDRLTPETTFTDLGVDSLAAIGIISEVEEAFNLVVPNEEAVRIRTVGEAIASLERALGAEGKGA
jgi:acyl carrier protein